MRALALGDDLRSTAEGALLGAVLGALALGVVDAGALLAHGGGARAVIAPLAAALVLASLAALLALTLVLAARGALLGLARVGIEWSSSLCALVVASFSVLGAQALVLVVLSGSGIRSAVVSLSAALGVGVGVALAAAGRVLAARVGYAPSLRARTAYVIAASGGTLVLVVLFSPGLVEELDVRGLSAAGAPLVLALALALWGGAARGLARAALAVWLALAVFGVAHAALPAPGDLTRLIARETDASRYVLGTLWPRTQRALPPLPEGRGTCEAGVSSSASSSARATARDGAPDLILVTVDAMRWDHTTLSAYARDTTPELSRWARSAAVFSSAMTPASSTRQTFRALFSGLYPSQVLPAKGKSWWRVSLAPEQHTLAEQLHEAGYRTVSVTERGDAFEPNVGALDGFDVRLRALDGDVRGGDKREARARSQIDHLLREARAERDEPLFAWAHILTPHQPYIIGSRSPYGKDDVDRYDWALHFVDGELARLLQGLKDDGRLAHTYVIVTADHGQAFGEHGNQLHGITIYQEETHVPLLVWGPDVQPGRRAAPVSVLDLFPTLLELGGAVTPRSACGATLHAWLTDPARAPTRALYMEQIPDKRAYFQAGFVRGPHKLVVTPPEGALELFDLRADPREQHDVSRQDPKLTDELVEALVAFLKQHGLDPASYGL